MVTKTIEHIRAIAGSQSLVGIHGNPPVSFGNYFYFKSGERCVNMWCENLEDIARKKSLSTVECTVFSNEQGRLAFVTDDRVPKEYLYGGVCTTGAGFIPRELIEAICAFQGVSTEGRICGCEAPEQGSHVSECWYEGKHEYCCQLCNRRW